MYLLVLEMEIIIYLLEAMMGLAIYLIRSGGGFNYLFIGSSNEVSS